MKREETTVTSKPQTRLHGLRSQLWVLALVTLVAGCVEPKATPARCDGADCEPSAGCGDGELQGVEECDGDAMGGLSCATLSAGVGSLSCDHDCLLDLSGCSAGCSDQCDAMNATRCIGETVESCRALTVGCQAWQRVENCAATERVCEAGACVCADSCATGALRCQDNRVERCSVDSLGCSSWQLFDDCTARTAYCDPSGATPTCVVSCTDICEEGATRCLYNFVQSCQVNAYDCLVWQDLENCNNVGHDCVDDGVRASCSADSSSTSSSSSSSSSSSPSSTSTEPETCEDLCVADTTRCSGSWIQSCELDQAGCLAWLNTENCSGSHSACEQSADAAVCIGS